MNMIEIKSHPYENSIDSLQTLIENIRDLIYVAEEKNLLICPLGTYPGKFNAKIRTEKKFKLQKKYLELEDLKILPEPMVFIFILNFPGEFLILKN